jgi:hypothetical protein
MARPRRIIAFDKDRVSVSTKSGAIGIVQEHWDEAARARDSAEFLQTWHDLSMKRYAEVRPDMRPTLPGKAPEDVRSIAETAFTPTAKSLVDQFSQQCRVEGLRLENETNNSPAWQLFNRNRMGGKQVSLYKASFLHGQAFAVARPAVGRLDNAKTAAFELRSARRMTGFYRADFDEFPEIAIDVDVIQNADGTRENIVQLIDDTYVHRLSCPEGEPEKLQYIDNEKHGVGVTPVQRFGLLTLDGEAHGEVFPYLTVLRRLDQDTTDRLVLQRYLSWMVRYGTGIKKPKTEEEQAEAEYWMEHGDLLINESVDAKFGVLQGQPMDGHISARQADMQDLAGVSQVPSYRLLGLSDNIGAEAIAAADASLKRKMDEYKAVFGEQMESLMRLGGAAMKDSAISGDFTSRVQWAVTENIDIQSLSQAINQLNAEDRGIPFEMLWRWVPGWQQSDTEEAKRIREKLQEERQAQALLEAAMNGGGSGGNNTGNPAGRPAPARTGAAG